MKKIKWKRMIAGILAAVTCMMNCGLSAAASEPGATGDTGIEAVEEAMEETVTGTEGNDIGKKDIDTKDTVSDSTVPDLTGELQDGAAEEEKSEEAVE